MIWATVSSWSHFCWLDRVSPSSVAKSIISMISVLTIWWCPCVASFLVLLKECVCYDQCILLAKLLAFGLLHSVLQGQICLLLQVSIDFLLLHSSPLWWTVSLVAQTVKYLPAMWEARVRSLGQEDPLDKEMATHSSTLAWRIPWTEEPGRLQSMGSQRVGHNWVTSVSFSFPIG